MRPVRKFIGRAANVAFKPYRVWRLAYGLAILASGLLGLVAWPLAIVGPLVAIVVILLAAGARAESELSRVLDPGLAIECGNDIHDFLKQWYGSGATQHPPILLLRIRNLVGRAAKNCRVQLTLDPADARYKWPRNLPWWEGYRKYSKGEKPAAIEIAPEGHAFVVLVDSALNDIGAYSSDETGRPCVEATVRAWCDDSPAVVRTFRLAWDDPASFPTIEAHDGVGCTQAI